MTSRRKTIPESDHLYEYGIDLPRSRVYLTGDVDLKSVMQAIQGMSMLARQSDDATIQLIINSEGGDMTQGFALIDYIRSLPNPVHGIVLGNCESAALVILQVCTTRSAGMNSTLMTHRGTRQTAFDKTLDERADQILADRMGLSLKQLDKFHSYDRYLTAQEALELKLLDSLMENLK